MKRKKTKSYIKNHVSQHGKSINNVLPKTFGFGIQDLEQALAGDRQKLQQIGEAARQGKLSAELMPILEQAYSHIIEGTTSYNTGVSRILKQAGKSSTQIDKGISQVSLANQRYINDRREIKTDYTNSRDAENTRHKYALDYTQLRAYIDQYLVGVDHQGRMLDQANRPEIKQVAEDIKFDQTVAKHLVENGEDARPDLISYREYVPNQSQQQPQEKVTFASRINQIKSAFGF